jgi:hypothetical protein
MQHGVQPRRQRTKRDERRDASRITASTARTCSRSARSSEIVVAITDEFSLASHRASDDDARERAARGRDARLTSWHRCDSLISGTHA